jgi:hypothetical protein
MFSITLDDGGFLNGVDFQSVSDLKERFHSFFVGILITLCLRKEYYKEVKTGPFKQETQEELQQHR